MTINDAIRKYRLPSPTCQEDLECRWSKVLNFGDKVILAGYYYNGPGKPSYFGAVYEFIDDGSTVDDGIGLLKSESPIALREVSEVEFEDDGHAMAWAMQNA